MNIHSISWAAFLVLGMWAAWMDLREKRVANRWVLAGLATCAALYAALGLGFGAAAFGPTDGFFLKAAVDAALSAAAAIALWRFGLWPAGDAKLFIVFCLLLGLMDPNLRGFPGYLWLILLINSFVIAGMFILGVLAVEWARLAARLATTDGRRDARGLIDRARKRLREEWPCRGGYAVLLWNTVALFILCRLFLGRWRSSPSQGESLALYAGFYVVWGSLSRWLARSDVAKYSFLIISLGALPAGLFWKHRILSDLWAGSRQALGFCLLMPAGRILINVYLDRTRRYRVERGDLRPGLILSAESWKSLMPLVAAGAPEAWTRYADGLSAEEAAWLERNAAAQVGAGLEAHRAVPFAQWLFLGALWTVLLRENVVECLMRLR